MLDFFIVILNYLEGVLCEQQEASPFVGGQAHPRNWIFKVFLAVLNSIYTKPGMITDLIRYGNVAFTIKANPS